MLIDEATITIKAGNGGNGSLSFKRNAQTSKGGPDGGNGGKGGDLYIQGINDISALMEFRYKKNIQGNNGVNGGKNKLFGKNGEDKVIYVPLGTKITDLNLGKSFEIENSEKVLIAKGGKGGRGNNEFKTAIIQAPRYAENGEPGEEKKLFLELKLIADIGLIGLPNSGKSSLLSILTNAHPKIGNYAFTTLEPNLGVFNGVVIADIPGLIEGASKGKGLGIKFLKHIEKTKEIIHCIDINSTDLYKAYLTVRNELDAYSKILLQKKEIVLLTKSDQVNEKNLSNKIKQVSTFSQQVYPISIYNKDQINNLKKQISSINNISI